VLRAPKTTIKKNAQIKSNENDLEQHSKAQSKKPECRSRCSGGSAQARVPRRETGGLLTSNPVTFEFEVDRLRGREFLRLMREVRLIHRRNGAFSWRLHEDLMCSTATARAADKGGTGDDQQSLARLHVGEDVPEERYYLCVNTELDARGTTVAILRACPNPRWI
jgi:hypothetical protein